MELLIDSCLCYGCDAIVDFMLYYENSGAERQRDDMVKFYGANKYGNNFLDCFRILSQNVQLDRHFHCIRNAWPSDAVCCSGTKSYVIRKINTCRIVDEKVTRFDQTV